MKRLAVLAGFLVVLANTAIANTTFNKFWKEEYASKDADEGFQKAVRTHGCFVCHVNGEDKKKVRNEYGAAIHEYLKAEDFPAPYVKDNPEEAKARIVEGFKKAGKHLSKDGKSFEAKLSANELPATDSGK